MVIRVASAVKGIVASTLMCSAAIALLASAGCGPKRVATPTPTPDPSRLEVVLLPDTESTAPSSVTVTGKSGRAALTTPYESTTVIADRPPTPPVKKDEAEDPARVRCPPRGAPRGAPALQPVFQGGHLGSG